MTGNGVLVLGSGGREHALAWKLAQNGRKVCIAPGNGSPFGSVPDLNIDDENAIIAYCKKENLDLVVVGPEVPLSKGIVDRLRGRIKVFGPSQAGANLETSKVFAKNFMKQWNLPTARFAEFDNVAEATSFIEKCAWHGIVVKADGLAAGKGVVVAENRVEAQQAAQHMLEGEFGESSKTILLEERLDGFEVSALCFTDGKSFARMPLIRDHKRLRDNDEGPNTGGMGVVGPVAVSARINSQIDEILRNTVDGLAKMGIEYKGVLYAGFMITAQGPHLLEFNCRFGDPETEILMRMLKTDLYKICMACIDETLDKTVVEWTNEHACGVVLAAGTYPQSGDKGTLITDIPADSEHTVVFHAGTAKQNGNVVTSGGRILCVTSTGATLEEARKRVIATCELIQFNGKFFRRDIGSLPKARSAPTALTYGDSGVDINEGNQFVEDIKSLVKSTLKSGTSQIGGFGAVVDFVKAGYSNASQIVVGIDGVGTKIEIADAVGDYTGIGYDVVGMCVNDVLCHNAAPIAFLDYFVCGKLDRRRAATVVKSIAEACIEADCSLVGGETAEMPGVYGPKQWDLAGCAIAVRDPKWLELPQTSAIQAGDIVIGLKSSGAHSNGFSLIRKIFAVNKIAYDTTTPWDLKTTFGKVLLAPTRLYVRQMLPLMREGLIKGCAHITGGGIAENAIRVLDPNGSVGLEVDAASWEKPELFHWLAGMGPVEPKEMLRAFNSGIGMIMIVSAGNQEAAQQRLSAINEPSCVIGRVVERRGGELISFRNLERAFHVSRYAVSRKRVRVGIIISGAGSNMKCLIERASRPGSNCEVAVVISNKADAGGLKLAGEAGVATAVVPHTNPREIGDRKMTEVLKEHGVELICLAGFMRILSAEFVRTWSGRTINIHPSLLPSFKGAHAVREALAAGVKVTGCTAHFTVEEVDAGSIIAQEVVRVEEDDTEDSLHEKIKVKEHLLFPDAMELVADRLLSNRK